MLEVLYFLIGLGLGVHFLGYSSVQSPNLSKYESTIGYFLVAFFWPIILLYGLITMIYEAGKKL